MQRRKCKLNGRDGISFCDFNWSLEWNVSWAREKSSVNVNRFKHNQTMERQCSKSRSFVNEWMKSNLRTTGLYSSYFLTILLSHPNFLFYKVDSFHLKLYIRMLWNSVLELFQWLSFDCVYSWTVVFIERINFNEKFSTTMSRLSHKNVISFHSIYCSTFQTVQKSFPITLRDQHQLRHSVQPNSPKSSKDCQSTNKIV